MLTLSGRTAVVTGGSQNIGFAISREFAENGMNVGILSLHKENAEKAARVLKDAGQNCIGLQCDVAMASSVKSALNNVHTYFGSIDVVVNCAGILDLYQIQEMPVEYWDKVMAVNLKGTFLLIQHSLKYLEKSYAPRIINISSNAGRMGGFENGMAYTASKGGIIAISYGIARKLANKGITVNCIAPGTIDSEMTSVRGEETVKRLIDRIPIGRLGKAKEVATAACYFASEESAFTTGAVLDVNGGMFMG
ncbi:MAG: SDR family NAD(P)-dependent oxidoreductase [Desulfobacteraceae bacterium]|jgi:3-oxoacyl-[acyl-carrier protein] reductase